MLSSLLPGLRELRTPLAIGWTWLVTLWVAFGHLVPREEEATGLVGSIYEMARTLGRGGVLAALTFIAYLLGSLTEREPKDWRPGRSLEPEPSRRRNLITELFGSPWYAPRLELQALLIQKLERVDADLSRIAGCREHHAALRDIIITMHREIPSDFPLWGRAASEIMGQLTELETRLLARNREVYDYYDRLWESSALRLNLSPAVGALGVATGMRLLLDRPPWWALIALLLTAVLAYALWARGVSQYGRSQFAIATAVVTDIIESPILEAWKERVQRRPDSPRSDSHPRSS